ncbi:MAG: hypothetical protein ACNA7V_09740 [Bacteroidales bacterium]
MAHNTILWTFARIQADCPDTGKIMDGYHSMDDPGVQEWKELFADHFTTGYTITRFD